jgi:hypothetical protein
MICVCVCVCVCGFACGKWCIYILAVWFGGSACLPTQTHTSQTTNRTVTELDVARNRWGDDGAIALATALRANPCITDLSARGNDAISEVGALALYLAAQCCPGLHSASLPDVPFSVLQSALSEYVYVWIVAQCWMHTRG